MPIDITAIKTLPETQATPSEGKTKDDDLGEGQASFDQVLSGLTPPDAANPAAANSATPQVTTPTTDPTTPAPGTVPIDPALLGATQATGDLRGAQHDGALSALSASNTTQQALLGVDEHLVGRARAEKGDASSDSPDFFLSQLVKSRQASGATDAADKASATSPVSTTGLADIAQGKTLGQRATHALMNDSQAKDTATANAMARELLTAPTDNTPASTAPTGSVANTPSNASSNPNNPTAVVTLATPLHHPAWGEQMTHQIKQFVLERIGVAEIRLNPQELGPIRVEIAVDQSQAAVHFSAQHQETRDALSQQLGRLREVMSQIGLTLDNATTGSFSDNQAFSFMQQQARDRDNGQRRFSAAQNADDVLDAVPVTTLRSPIRTNHGVDLFA